MRFEELALERYGAFQRREIVFPANGLVVVYGPNEAGKSTALAGIGDFLFGVPAQSPYGSLYGYDAMRIEARLVRSDGSKLQLRRRKGRTRTLSDFAGAAVDDAALSSLLGATNRDRFETLFGLDHERLRRGGERLLEADGEIGKLIVEAGGGLKALVGRLEAVDADLAKLFAPRKSADRAFYKALDAFEAADRAARDGAVSREAYEKARAARGAAAGEVERLRKAVRDIAIERSGLERLTRVIPLLSAHDGILAELAVFAGIDRLPDAFDAEIAAAIADRRAAGQALQAAEDAAESLAARLAAVLVDDALVAAQVPIRDVEAAWPHVAKARDDRPNRLRELERAEERLASLRRRIGAGPDAELASRLPPPEAIEALRRLATAATARAERQAGSERRVAELERRVRALDERLAAAKAAGFDRPSGVIVSEFIGLGADDANARTLRREAEARAAEAASQASALGFADAEEARALPCPSIEDVVRTISRLDGLNERRLRQVETLAEAESRRDAALAEIARLQAGGEVASDAALAGARRSRDGLWEPIRAAFVAGITHRDQAARLAETAALADAVTEADDMSDRRVREAGRVADLVQAERRRDEASAAIAAMAKAAEALAAEILREQEQFAAAFPDATARSKTLAELKILLERRRTLLDTSEAAHRSLGAAEAAEASLVGPKAALESAERACGLSPGSDATVADRVRAAVSTVARRDAAYVEVQADARARDEAAPALDAARTELADIARETEVWAQAWTPALERAGLPATASPEEASDVALEWTEARGVLEGLETTRRRIARIDEDEEALAHRAHAIGADVGLELPDDAIAASRMLLERHRANEDARKKRDALSPDLQEAGRQVEARRRTFDEAVLVRKRLADRVGLIDPRDDDLLALADRCAARRRARERQAELLRTIVSAGDGRTLIELAEDAAGRDLDAVRADVSAARNRADELQAELESAVLAEHAARSALDDLQNEETVNRAVVLRESAIAELHDVVERYVELALARDLVEAATARVRAERQDPMVARAGALFALATRGAFEGVAADVDDRGAPVIVGRRADGRTIGVSAMSDGTRDQLFLAFRLASLEDYCRATEPLPFVADDVLVHFDDARSAATLELLADFGDVTQTLLFTHHRSVLEMAERLAADGRCGVVEIG